MLFGELIRKHREEKGLPLRKIAAECDIDTSILSKIERSERFATSDIIPILSKSLDIEFKALQMLYLTEKIDCSNPRELLKFISPYIKSEDKLITGSNVGDDIFNSLSTQIKELIIDYPPKKFLEFELVLVDIIKYLKRSTEAQKNNPNFKFLFDSNAKEGDLQASMINMFKFNSKRADYYSEENKEFADGGRVDIKYQNSNITIPLELKRTYNIITEDRIKEDYLSQAQTYTYNRDQLGFLYY